MRDRPLLLLDVDGPLNPFAAKAHQRPEGYLTHRMMPTSWTGRTPLRVWLNPLHGRDLLALPYALVWCTTWEDDSNTLIAPEVGLPELPVIHWDEPGAPRADGIHWKTREVAAYAAGRPFAWVDDEHGPADTAYIAEHHQSPHLLHHVDPRVGLRAEDFTTLQAWAHGLEHPAEQGIDAP